MQSGSDVFEFALAGNCTSHIVLDDLEFVDMVRRQIEIERIAVVEL